MTKTIKLGLIGLGTVGAGVVRILQNHHDDFQRDQEIDLQLVAVASRVEEEAIALGVRDIFSFDGADVVNNPDVDIVIELVGGTTFAKDFVFAALNNGKTVVSANKALVAEYGRDLLQLAADNNVEIAFEASVGGGIPIISPLRHSLAGNRIENILGIVNGTTNYMLSKMKDEGLDYDVALKQAQDNGFAEANPSADVDGFDAGAKIAILAMIGFNTDVRTADVHIEGISKLSAADLANADDFGYAVKLLAIANRTKQGIDIRVHPTMVAKEHPLASVNGVFNAIYVVGDAVGETMFYGAGAGAGPAASSVVGDVIELARHLAFDQSIAQPIWDSEKLPIVPIAELETSYYLRLSLDDQKGVLAKSAQIFADNNVSIYSAVQQGAKDGSAQLVYITHAAKESDVQQALQQLRTSGVLKEEPVLIRVQS
jgi:homoserine dehydrogenase